MKRVVLVVGGVVLVAALLLVLTSGADDPEEAADPTPTASPAARLPEVTDARTVLSRLDAVWRQNLPKQVPTGPALILGTGTLKTGCGPSPQDEGSFYCGEDRTIYLQQVDLAGPAGTRGEVDRATGVYVVAHEYGHYLQDRLGVPEGGEGKGPDSDSVRYELQADCLAGVFVASQQDRPGEPDEAAYREAVRLGGDDIGEDPLPVKEYEHGTGQQRVASFVRGLRGTAPVCLGT